MSSKTKTIGKKVGEEYSKMYMNNMYDLFNLPLGQLLKLRRKYLRHMKAREKERKQLSRMIKRRGSRI